MTKPELKQFADLTLGDFERYPVWIGCHTADYDERWYDGTDEQTFRPRTGTLPASPTEGMLLVKASLELRDGARYSGFVTPAQGEGELGIQQPQIFVGERRFQFWGGTIGVREEERKALYAALGKSPDDIFPLRFSVDPSLATGATSGQIEGFYRGFPRSVQVDR